MSNFEADICASAAEVGSMLRIEARIQEHLCHITHLRYLRSASANVWSRQLQNSRVQIVQETELWTPGCGQSRASTNQPSAVLSQ